MRQMNMSKFWSCAYDVYMGIGIISLLILIFCPNLPLYIDITLAFFAIPSTAIAGYMTLTKH